MTKDRRVTGALEQAHRLAPDAPQRELLYELEAAQLRGDGVKAEVMRGALRRLGYAVPLTLAPAEKVDVHVSAADVSAALPQPAQHLRPASESGSADIQRLVAEYESARLNGNRARAAVLVEEAARLGFKIT